MARTNRRNYYRILHVQPDAPAAVIRSSYRTLMQRLRMHPDLGGDHWNAALLNEAYHVLNDPERRAEYDRSRPDLHSPAGDTSASQAADAAGPASTKPRSATGALNTCPFCHAPHQGSADPDPVCPACASPLVRAAAPAGTADWRRLVGRVPKRMPLLYWARWPETGGREAELLDLSLTGLRFAAAAPQRVDQFLKIDSPAFQAVARVVRCARHDGGWTIAAEFLTLRFHRSRGSFVSDQA